MPTRLGYRPSLDGIRGLAIASVVGFHAFGHPAGGYLGVDLFFVLSGFLITTLLLEERSERGRVSLRAFYARRALRLLPGLAVMLATVVAVAVVRAVATGDEHDLGRTLTFAAAGLTCGRSRPRSSSTCSGRRRFCSSSAAGVAGRSVSSRSRWESSSCAR